MSSKPLRILVADDSEDDVLLLVRYLRRYGYAPTYERVDTAAAMSTALQKQTWDIVISDYIMPHFSGPAVLKSLRETSPDLPCIVVSGKIGEDTAVEAMRAGACDYIMKDNLKRLGPAIDRELHESAARRERRKAAEALGQREEELRLMKKMDELKDEFLGLVSHEMRNPLTIIIGALHTALTEGDKLSREDTRQLMEDALHEGEALSEILANLLELAKIQANRLRLTEERVDVGKTIDKVVTAIRRQTTKHRMAVDCPDSLIVSADRVRLERILYNLVDNAVKYSPPDSEVKVFARRNSNDVLIGVADRGIGISNADLGRLFKPFQRLDLMDSGIGGTGLGLVVCQRLVEAHHGRIWVESQPGQGSTFRFTLPLMQSKKN